eukprot:CAMPEP_0196573106 /NCGR_PEP_ID=MMETSP1081-20130531/3055_1 /TAXON_ID=36882 /ORGANISM="Pyramimonas amylifera, Strain CCMP720" /LENGTH=498 /DNA_ID=CAMNT_0041890693 /DNA_START=153 /DNA_END=1650 /DNA_ORIENTATION=+
MTNNENSDDVFMFGDDNDKDPIEKMENPHSDDCNAQSWALTGLLALLFFWLAGIEAGHPIHQLLDSSRIAGPTGVSKSHPASKIIHHATKLIKSTRGCALPCFNVADYGAVPDGVTLATAAINSALDALKAKGSGTLYFPAGEYLTGPFDLLSYTSMVLHDSATLQFVSGTDGVVGKYAGGQIDWPHLPWIEYPAETAYGPHKVHRQLIGGHKLKSVSISGGTIDGGGHFWYEWDEKPNPPNGIHILETDGLTISDITLKNFPKFVLRPQFCKNVAIHRIKIKNSHKSPGTNGIVIDSSEDVVVTESEISTGDKEDAIVVKSGENWFGRARNAPSRNVLVQRCSIRQGHAVSVGSETSGGIYNVKFKGIEFHDAGSMRVKSQRGRGGTVDGVSFEDIRGHNALYALEFYLWYTCKGDKSCEEPGNKTVTPIVKNISVRNVEIHGVSRDVGIIEGLPESPFQGLILENIHVDHANDPWNCHKFKPAATGQEADALLEKR